MSDLAKLYFHNSRTRSKAELNQDSLTIWLDGEDAYSGPFRDGSGLPIARAWLYQDGTLFVTDADDNEIAIGHLQWGDPNPKIAGRASLTILTPNTTYKQGDEINYIGFARTVNVDNQTLRVVNFVKERPLATRNEYQRPAHPTVKTSPKPVDDTIHDDDIPF